MTGVEDPASNETTVRSEGRPASGAQRAARAAFLLVIYFLAASFALSEFVRFPGLASIRPEFGGERFFGDMIYGRAPRPYVSRALVPLIVRGVAALAPAADRAVTLEYVRRTMTRDGRPEWLYQYGYEFVVVRYVLLVFLLGFAFSLWWLAKLSLNLSGPALDLLPVVALFGLPGLYGYASMLYDFPSLCLFTLGLALIATRRFWPYFIVFVVATVNKETALLLTLVWVVVEWRRLGWRKAATLGVLQVLAWLLVRGGLTYAFRANYGEWIALHLFRNLVVLAKPANYVLFRGVGNWLMVPMGFSVVYIAGFIAALIFLRCAPQVLRQAFLITIPIAVLTMLFGNVDEMRVYYELYPVLFLVLAAGAYRLLGYTPARA